MARTKYSLVARLALCSVMLFSSLALSGCENLDEAGYLKLILDWLNDQEGDSEDADAAKGPVALSFTYPAGKSPKVFVKGWVFGARCIATDKDGDTTDISDKVKWSGSGTFAPEVGAMSRPTFNGPGINTIKLTVDYGGKTYAKTLRISAVNTALYARLGDKTFVAGDAHGCPGCPHPCIGPITQGSPNVYIDGMPAARKGDVGVHAACCGSNSFTIVEGDPNVLINGKPAAKKGMAVKHCGGMGYIIEGSAGS